MFISTTLPLSYPDTLFPSQFIASWVLHTLSEAKATLGRSHQIISLLHFCQFLPQPCFLLPLHLNVSPVSSFHSLDLQWVSPCSSFFTYFPVLKSKWTGYWQPSFGAWQLSVHQSKHSCMLGFEQISFSRNTTIYSMPTLPCDIKWIIILLAKVHALSELHQHDLSDGLC